MNRAAAIMVILALLQGCASKLLIYDAHGQKSKGVPVNQPVLVRIFKTTSYKVAPGEEHAGFATLCAEASFQSADHAFLPLGAVHYITFDPAALGKGEFKLEFTDAGLLKTVSLNSDATAGVEAVTSLIGTALPFVATPKGDLKEDAQSMSTLDSLADDVKNHCISAGTVVTRVERLPLSEPGTQP